MVIELLHRPPTFSNFSPAGQKVKDLSIDCFGKAFRKGDKLQLTVISRCALNDYFNGTTHEVLNSETKYEVITDGSLDVEGLYEVYEHAMVTLLRGLYNLELNSGMQPTRDLHPLPPTDEFLEMVKSQVDAFNMGLPFNNGSDFL